MTYTDIQKDMNSVFDKMFGDIIKPTVKASVQKPVQNKKGSSVMTADELNKDLSDTFDKFFGDLLR